MVMAIDRPTTSTGHDIALFDVKSTAYLASRSLYVIAGEIRSGIVRPGMRIEIEWNSTINMHLDVLGIEFMRRPEGELVALIISISGKQEADIIDAMGILGSRLRLTLPSSGHQYTAEALA
jgi:hypothetical protein